MSLRNARGNKAYYDYTPHKGSWPAWERRQKRLLISLAIVTFIVCAGIIVFLLLAGK